MAPLQWNPHILRTMEYHQKYEAKVLESATDFLVRVSGAVDGLARDWKGVVSQHEIKALLSEVFINGVQEEFRHVLNSKMAKYGELTEEQMYYAVKRHEVYLGRTKCLGGGRIYLHQPSEEYNSTGLQ